MSSRLSHRLSLALDRDVLHAGAVALSACALSAGLVYVGYFVHVWRVAKRAPCEAVSGECVLLFGKNAPQGRIDRDFAARLDRAVSLWQQTRPGSLVLLGGGKPGERSEAEIARDGLHARGFARDFPVQIESQSRDTLQNLRNARLLLGEGARTRVTLLSNRYHLARCALFARQLGFDWELCAAEPELRLGPRTLWRLAGEAAYLCWADLGTRWARLIRHRRMLERVTRAGPGPPCPLLPPRDGARRPAPRLREAITSPSAPARTARAPPWPAAPAAAGPGRAGSR